MIDLNQQDGIHVMRLGDDENLISLDWLKAVNVALDEVVKNPAPLVTIAEGKFYSNGLDLEWLMANGGQVASYVADVQHLLARVLTLPVPTVAAVSGHAFGAGAMVALAHDWRIMREDRGYYCFPEVDIRVPFTPGMSALLQAKLSPQVAVVAMTTGHRYGAAEALTSGLIDATAPQSELLSAAIAKLTPLIGKDATTLGTIKATMFAEAAGRLRDQSAA